MTLMTVKEFGRRIGVARASAYKIVAAGQIDTVDVGTGKRPRLRISEQALEKYVARKEVKAA